jgi:S1-C subfamily serine protease
MLRYLLLLFPLLFACAPAYNLTIDKVRAPLSEDSEVLVSFGGQSIVGDVDTLGTLDVITTNAAKCNPDQFFDKALAMTKESGGNGFHITSINFELNGSLIPCASFTGKIVNTEYTYYDVLHNEEELKEKWRQRISNLEGIYEGKDPNGFDLRVAINKEKTGNYNLIYLSGMGERFESVWEEGQLKAAFKSSASTQLFKIDWISSNRTLNKDFIISIGPGLFTLTNSTEKFSEPFLKVYPTSNDITMGSGTGFSISRDGFIATNNHVIENAENIFVRGVNGDFSQEYEARVVVKDENNDLAILQLIESDSLNLTDPHFGIALKSNTLVGENIFTLGYPLRSSMGDELKITNGIISSRTGYNGDITSYQVSAPIQPGNSGGPLFDSKGNVIGIINAKLGNAENVTYAIKSAYLGNLIDLLPPSVKINTNLSSEEVSISEKVQKVRDFVYIITVK